MWKNKVSKLQIFVWYYTKSFKNRRFLYIALAVTKYFYFNQKFAYVVRAHWLLYAIYCFSLHMVSPSNSALACTPLKIKDIIKANSLILLSKFIIICLRHCLLKAFLKNTLIL